MPAEYVSGTTPDLLQAILAQLRDLLPQAFPDGELDPGAMLAALGYSDGQKPSFSFTWPGIDQARAEARAPTSATLVLDRHASLNADTARDVLIEGDNLQVLKLLKSGYHGQVKLIYIDPPYNTGETFTYHDDYSVAESEYMMATGQLDEEGNATTSKIDNAGRKHAPWLTMMFPRLAVARHLLRRDGIILVSIDNNEVHHLRLLLDAVFGATNFVDMMTWRGARKGDAKLTAGGQDYILVYARDLQHLKANDIRWRERKTGLEQIYAKVGELRTEYGEDYATATEALDAWYKSRPEEDPSKAHAHYRVIDTRGVYFPGDISSPNPRPNLKYPWKGYAIPENGWRYEQPTMERLDADDRLHYPDSKDKRIQVKRYLHEHEEWAPASVFYKDRRAASKALETLMGEDVFDNPKDVDVLARLIRSMTGDGDLVLDFFAGSGSTGHAVWLQNRADGKTRHWLLVQVPEAPDASKESGKNAVNAGYATIFEIAAERLRRAAASLNEKTPDGEQCGFRVFRVGKTNLIIHRPIVATEGMTGAEYVQLSLMLQGDPVVQGADPLAVAWEVALKATGMPLDARVTPHELEGVTVFEFAPPGSTSPRRLFVSLDAFDLTTADSLHLSDDDTLILRGDVVSDATTLTLAPRLQSRLVLLERVPREVSL